MSVTDHEVKITKSQTRSLSDLLADIDADESGPASAYLGPALRDLAIALDKAQAADPEAADSNRVVIIVE